MSSAQIGDTPLDAAQNDATREAFRQALAIPTGTTAAKKKSNQKKNKKRIEKRKSKAAVDADSDSDAPDEGPGDAKESGRSSAPLLAPGSALPLPLPPTVASSSSATAAASAPLRPPLTPQEMSSAQLYDAACDGDVGAVRTLLNRPAGIVAGFINGAVEDEWTALLIASQGGHLEVARLLLEKGADTEAKTKVSAVLAVCGGYGGGN
ncbi:hypothetical protein B484DRAFT_223518 [Ochromonadaceae sp. CCMP2298]|nr:hypothetical protein B484DRAFT_223518 [Ochromonadaceae sp. CCMP2298]